MSVVRTSFTQLNEVEQCSVTKFAKGQQRIQIRVLLVESPKFQALRHCATAPLRHCATARLRDCATAPLRDCATALLLHSAAAPLRHCITAPLRHCVTASLRYCATASLLSYICLNNIQKRLSSLIIAILLYSISISYIYICVHIIRKFSLQKVGSYTLGYVKKKHAHHK